ncbi:hypothetical protein Anapl_15741 [Anas platyrhynchos]|uniref:Uncharacterized protein n=1 Tax=Anas platyrhynchos TaxID=8839 RepID=R0JI84_ANAPL|nr:hypothetical protein Anapl_15741 [Anas platyrhynchos]
MPTHASKFQGVLSESPSRCTGLSEEQSQWRAVIATFNVGAPTEEGGSRKEGEDYHGALEGRQTRLKEMLRNDEETVARLYMQGQQGVGEIGPGCVSHSVTLEYGVSTVIWDRETGWGPVEESHGDLLVSIQLKEECPKTIKAPDQQAPVGQFLEVYVQVVLAKCVCQDRIPTGWRAGCAVSSCGKEKCLNRDRFAKKEGKEVGMPVWLGSSMWVTAAQIGSSRILRQHASALRAAILPPGLVSGLVTGGNIFFQLQVGCKSDQQGNEGSILVQVISLDVVNIKSVYSIRLLQGNKANLYHFAGIKELKMHLHMERRQRSYPGQQNNVKHAQD